MLNTTHEEIARVCYTKNGNTWTETYKETDATEVYKALAKDIINKKLLNCRYIKTINNRCNYDGTRTITIYYNNNCKNEYTIET